MDDQGTTTIREPAAEGPVEQRRGFFAKAAAIVIGGLVALFPFAAGLGSFLDPVIRKRKQEDSNEGFLPLTTLDALPSDGTPVRVQVIVDRDDAWARYPNQPVGAVYLRRIGSQKVQAFTATCPHAGCFVAYSNESRQYICPCHNSAFQVDGTAVKPTPSPRDLDELEVKLMEVDGLQTVQVKFQEFFTGRAHKEPKV